MTEDHLSPEHLAATYLARFDWGRERQPGPPPPSSTLSLWEQWIQEDPERAWPLFEALVQLRPTDDEVLEQVWYRLRQLLTRHGIVFEDRVRAMVAGNSRLRRIVPTGELTRAAHRPKRLDIPKLVDAYLLNAVNAPDAHELRNIITADAESGITLTLEIISRGPLHGFGSFDTFSPLRDVLRTHGPDVIERVEAAAAGSALVRRCLWHVARHQGHPPERWDIREDVFERATRAIAGTTDYNTDEPVGVAKDLPPDYERVIHAWFVYEATFWAWQRVEDLIHNDPDPAWRVINLAVALAPSPDVLSYLGAGPLEEFLNAHGDYFIGRIEDKARDDERFRTCLSAVWQSDMSSELWARVRLAAGSL